MYLYVKYLTVPSDIEIYVQIISLEQYGLSDIICC